MGDTLIPSTSMEWTINVEERMDVSSLQKKFHERLVSRILQAFNRCKRSVLSVCTRIWQVGANDPRRVIHSIKVGLALSVVSLFYFVWPMFDTFAENAIWIVMTVVIVFEFTVGATLSKGLNRSFATLLGGFLGVGVRYVTEDTDKNCERVILGVSIFALGAASTYSRFFPLIKKRYDYGVIIFLLTFNLIAISGYRDENIFKMAHQRMSTIVIGCAFCFAINVIVFPIWAGDDLHKSILRNMEGLAESLEECITTYFVNPNDGQRLENDVPIACKSVLNSKATEESLVNFATWEPPHGRFFFRYPWNLYENVGRMTRHYAYWVDALDGLLKSEIQVPFSVIENLRTPCFELGRESANILRELAETVRTTRRSNNPNLMRGRLSAVVENLQNSLTADLELFIDTESSQLLEKNFSEGLTAIENLHASSIQNSEKQADLISKTSPGTSTKGEEIQADKSRDRADQMCQTRNMKRNSSAFTEVLPLARFSALLLETVAKLESVIMAVEELGEGANFEKTDQNVNECPPSTSLTQTTTSPTSTSSKQIIRVSESPSTSPGTTIPTATRMTDYD
eukprot:PITA_10410